MSNGFDVRLDPDFKEVRGWMRTLPDKVVDQATVRTLNRLARVANTHSKRGISRATGLKNKYVGKWIRIRRAPRGSWESSLDINRIGQRTSLRHYPHRVKYVRKNGRKYQQVEFRKAVAGHPSVRSHQDRLFKARDKWGRDRIFARKTAQRLPLTSPKGPSMGELFNDHGERSAREQIRMRMQPEFERNFNYYMTRHNRRYSRSKSRK